MRHILHAALTLISFLLFGAACSETDESPYVDLSRRQPLPAVVAEGEAPLRLAISAVISPSGTIESYAPLADYLAQRLGRPVELVQRRTYAEVNDLIEAGAVDAAFVCTSAYVVGHRDFGMRLVAAPEVDGRAEYQSYILVPADSPARSMADLRGHVFAFTDPMSNTGRMYPAYLVQQLGATPEGFFRRTFFTFSHDNAVYAVANGLADGAGVDSLVYRALLDEDPSLAETTKIIAESPPFGSPPVVVNPDVDPALERDFRELLLELGSDPEGRQVLARLGADRFVEIEDGAYASVRELQASVGTLP